MRFQSFLFEKRDFYTGWPPVHCKVKKIYLFQPPNTTFGGLADSTLVEVSRSHLGQNDPCRKPKQPKVGPNLALECGPNPCK